MFERFNGQARRVIVVAEVEARTLGHIYIGTEHILLGLMHDSESVAAKALESLDIALEGVQQQIEEIIGKGQEAPSGHLPFAPQTKKLLEHCLREALQLGHNYIGTEHILLALIRESDGVAAEVLVKLGANPNHIRQQVLNLLADYEEKPAEANSGDRANRTRSALELEVPRVDQPPTTPAGAASLWISSDMLSFGDLHPGQSGSRAVLVRGGPGTATSGNAAITITPLTFGPGETILEIGVAEMPGERILSDKISLETTSEKVDIQVHASWQKPSIQSSGETTPVRVAFNGYGTLARTAHRVLIQWHKKEADVVAINVDKSTDLAGWMYRLKYDSIYGLAPFDISARNSDDPDRPGFLGYLTIADQEVAVYSEKDSVKLPWASHNIDVVVDSSGTPSSSNLPSHHIVAGAKSIVFTSPADGISTYVVSVNEKSYAGEKAISIAGPTVNCLAPLAKILDDSLGVENAFATVIIGYGVDQRLKDSGESDYRHAREAAENMVPLLDHAVRSAAAYIPVLKRLVAGGIIRVPAPLVLLCECTFILKRDVSTEEVKSLIRRNAGAGNYRGILRTSVDPLVSSDIIGNSHSCVVDSSLLEVTDQRVLRIQAWQDNIYGYANRVAESAIMVGKSNKKGAQTVIHGSTPR